MIEYVELAAARDSKGILKRGTASRYVSRLATRTAPQA